MIEPCPHDPATLATLREWAWTRGRTDIVLTLDLHARVWAFRLEPTRAHLRELESIAPSDHELRGRLHELAIAGATPPKTVTLSVALGRWCESSCRDIEAALEEMRASRDRALPPC